MMAGSTLCGEVRTVIFCYDFGYKGKLEKKDVGVTGRDRTYGKTPQSALGAAIPPLRGDGIGMAGD